MNIRQIVTLAFGLLFASIMQAQDAQPPATWQPIDLPGQPVDYYDYTSNPANNIEDTALVTPEHPATPPSVLDATPRPPLTYSFSNLAGPTGSARTVCDIVNQTNPRHPVYWFDPVTGGSLAGAYPFADPNLYNESEQLSGIKGMEFNGSFNGTGSSSEPGAAAIETVYSTNRQCTDAGLEFGFFRELVSADTTTIFYYSDYTNCANDCHTQNNNSPSTLMNELAYTVSISKIQNNSSGTQQFVWRAQLLADSTQPYGYRFQISVIDPFTKNLGTCSIAGAALAPCQYSVPMMSWYHADWVVATPAWIIDGVQAVPGFDGTNYYAPNVSPDASLTVNSISKR